MTVQPFTLTTILVLVLIVIIVIESIIVAVAAVPLLLALVARIGGGRLVDDVDGVTDVVVLDSSVGSEGVVNGLDGDNLLDALAECCVTLGCRCSWSCGSGPRAAAAATDDGGGVGAFAFGVLEFNDLIPWDPGCGRGGGGANIWVVDCWTACGELTQHWGDWLLRLLLLLLAFSGGSRREGCGDWRWVVSAPCSGGWGIGCGRIGCLCAWADLLEPATRLLLLLRLLGWSGDGDSCRC